MRKGALEFVFCSRTVLIQPFLVCSQVTVSNDALTLDYATMKYTITATSESI